MKKLTQTKTGVGFGNCLATTIASILDFDDVSKVDFDTSDFDKMFKDQIPEHKIQEAFYNRLEEKLKNIGWNIINVKYISYKNFIKKQNTQYHFLPWDCHCILSLPSGVDKQLHAIVGYLNNDRKITPAWDPDPNSPGHKDISFWYDKIEDHCKAVEFMVKR